jgi:AraC-like DNA-binding protein
LRTCLQALSASAAAGRVSQSRGRHAIRELSARENVNETGGCGEYACPAKFKTPARTVTEVGLMLGFAETSSFTTSFRRSVGVTPSDYRRSVA